MNRRLASFCGAFALTELAVAWLPAPALLPATAFLVCTFAVVLLLRFRGRRNQLGGAALILLGVVCGLCWATAYRFAVVERVQSLAEKTQTCTATVETDCENSYQDGMLRGTLHVTEVDGIKSDFRVYCSSFPGLEAGERFTGKLSFEIPDDDGYRMARYAKGVYLAAEYVSGYRQLESSDALQFAMLQLRRNLSQRLATYLPRELAAMESAMLLADKSQLSDAVTAAFRTAGVSHLLSVSGLHVALLCGLLTLGLGAGSRKRFALGPIGLQAIVLVAYMLLAGLPISVMRAGVIYLIALLGYVMLQPPDLLTSLGVAALLLSLQNAYTPCDVGFQLSFCGVLGVQLAGALERQERKQFAFFKQAALPKKTDENDEKQTLKLTLQTVFQYARYLLVRIVCLAQCAAIATAATMPVLLAHGLTTSGVAILSNVLVVWMLRYVLILGIAVLLLSALPVPMFMHMASLVLGVMLRVMYVLVDWCASLPFARMALPREYTLLVLAGLAVLALLFHRCRMLLWYLPATGTVTAVAVLLGVVMSKNVVTVAMVGTSGSPCLIITQNGSASVVFRGGAKNCEYIEEYLTQNNIGSINTLLDIRQKPTDTLPKADDVIVLEYADCNTNSIPVLPNIEAEVYHNSKGNLVTVNIAGYCVATMAGNPIGNNSVNVDAFCAAGSYPMGMLASDVLYTTKNPDWLGLLASGAELHYGESPVLVIRPGKSCVIKEATENAIQ